MRPWDIFRQSAGCLMLLATFCVATLFGYVLFWFDDRGTPFIDKPTAVQYAADHARKFCSSLDHPHPVDCTIGLLDVWIENKDG